MKTLRLAILLSLFAVAASGQIAFDAAATGVFHSAGSSMNHVCGANSYVIVLVKILTNTPTAATIAGNPLTLLGHVNDIWQYGAPCPVGTQSISVTVSSSSFWFMESTSYTGVSSVTPVGTTVVSSGTNAGPITVTISSVPGQLVVDAAGETDTSGAISFDGAPGVGQTVRELNSTSHSGSFLSGAISDKAGAASVTMSWTISGGTPTQWEDIATTLLPPATPTPTATQTFTPTKTFTATNTASNTPTPTATQTFTPSNTPSNTPTFTVTPTPTFTSTKTFTASSTPTPTSTATNTPTNTFTASSTPTPTPTSSNTPTFTFTASATATNTPSNTPTPTATPTVTNTLTNTFTPTMTFTRTPRHQARYPTIGP